MKNKIINIDFSVAVAFVLLLVFACEQRPVQQHLTSGHPSLILTPAGIDQIRTNLGQVPLFAQTLKAAVQEIDTELSKPIEVPIPKDLAGGYTHERHKANFFAMQKAGVLFQITENEKYAIYIRDMLLAYAELYPKLERHPEKRSNYPGKLFWQCLNDANWLVYTSQAYDCIYDWLDVDTKNKLNTELFRPYAEFLSIENPKFFNRLHNHSTWGNAAVGMIGLVMGDEELVDWALYVFDIEDTTGAGIDNDGASFDLKGRNEGGFIAQIDHSFSPDGYYTEGPYYQRYAMYPFLIFAQSLANKKPELGILDYREGLLIRAITALINQTNAAGEFFPINDSQKGMSLASRELVYAVSMAYHFGGNDPQLLSIVEEQGRVPLNDSGLAAAKGIAENKAEKYEYRSMELSDGGAGDEGGIGIIRAEDLTLVMKYAKQGMGHGHFDRLNFLLYNGEEEIFQDYGFARWVNIEHKDGGGYLDENETWAEQTVAHNTLVINKDSHFDGNVQEADKTSGTPYFFSTEQGMQIASAKELNAYEGIQMQRTMAVMDIEELENPLILDLFSVQAPEGTRYDMPLYYKGEIMSSNQKFQTNNNLTPMGKESGYQHLWQEAQVDLDGDSFSMTWFNRKNFFTMTTAVNEGDQAFLTRIGATDPNFNLRREPGLIHRRTGGNTVFASLYEIHGSYDYATEKPLNLFSSIANIKVLHESSAYAVVEFVLQTGETYQFAFSLSDDSENANHTVETSNEQIQWTGIYDLNKSNN